MRPSIRFQIDVPASPEQVWEAWATQAGALTFFAPECKVEPRPGGAYEMYFNLDAPAGSRGGEGLVFLALQAPRLLSFTWNAPPELAEVRDQRTHVTVRLEPLPGGQTRVHFCEDGFGEGGQWEERIEYFKSAWGRVVLPRLRYRFEHGPVDWANRPNLEPYQKFVTTIAD
jgi:uncharacterized protein YndB with AHSA1/START domain